jgi:hypothetical protein
MAVRLARETPITFWRGMNLKDASIDATKARKAALAGKKIDKRSNCQGNKKALLPRRHS